ncbi:glycosyltransferase family 4 protein [Bradyrhizobium sp. CCGB12]|uniref:glycosyltransferase family 4 protein n=1 Tax=Bradyrhizobium sp. CCGB12 TaxID=2949632 RepID=UPI0020B45E02|nr:glycosyltransferase family 4 protein [Bradyrhizobium sp. CCGB12]MCP3391786.1 glycosyltransferase family 4 protein [Bradyrhizobium sp. CCGB12]
MALQEGTGGKLKILLSAYACEPQKGSEPGVGWHWANELAKMGHKVCVLTRRNNRAAIEATLTLSAPQNLSFIYHDLPDWLMPLKKIAGTHLYYSIWQRTALKSARRQHLVEQFDCAHHITFGSWRQTTHLHKLGIPLLVGPIGGAEMATLPLVRSLPLSAQISEGIRYFINLFGLLNPMLRWALRGARVISKTRDTQRWLAQIGVTSEVSLEIGVDTAAMVPIGGRDRTGPLRLIFVGRLLGWKGVLLAIRAVAQARAAGTEVTLVIVGEGKLRSHCERLVASLGAETFISLVGAKAQKEVFAMLSSHDVMLFPSMHDSSGNVVLEAFGHGLPVICLELGGPATLVDAEVGIVVSTSAKSASEVISELAAAINRLASDHQLLDVLSEAARQRALDSSWAAAVGRVYAAPAMFKA